MPKIVDHDLRRHEIADAICRLIQREGLERVTFRDVAAEAQTSRGVLSHYFKDKDDLFAFTLRVVSDRSLERFATEPIEDFDDLVDCLLLTLPVDDTSIRDAFVWTSLWARTVNRPDFAAAMRACYRDWERAFAQILLRAEQSSILPAGSSAEDAVTRLAVLIDGLNFQAVLDPDAWPEERLRDVLAWHLASLAGRSITRRPQRRR